MRGLQERRVAPPLTEARSADGRHRAATWRRLAITSSVAAAVVLADQVTKTWAVHRLSRGPIHVVWKLDLMLSFNSGAAFGLARGWAPVLAALAVVIVVGLLVGLRGVRSTAMSIAVGLVVGGALGNLADRLFRTHHGAVVDFIALHFWPTFNVADSCIVIGVILATLLLWRGESGIEPAPAPPVGG